MWVTSISGYAARWHRPSGSRRAMRLPSHHYREHHDGNQQDREPAHTLKLQQNSSQHCEPHHRTTLQLGCVLRDTAKVCSKSKAKTLEQPLSDEAMEIV